MLAKLPAATKLIVKSEQWPIWPLVFLGKSSSVNAISKLVQFNVFLPLLTKLKNSEGKHNLINTNTVIIKNKKFLAVKYGRYSSVKKTNNKKI